MYRGHRSRCRRRGLRPDPPLPALRGRSDHLGVHRVHPDRVLSLGIDEPAMDFTEDGQRTYGWEAFDHALTPPDSGAMAEFMRLQVADDVELPPLTDPLPAWTAHLHTSHQAQPVRVAAALRRLWARADGSFSASTSRGVVTEDVPLRPRVEACDIASVDERGRRPRDASVTLAHSERVGSAGHMPGMARNSRISIVPPIAAWGCPSSTFARASASSACRIE